MEAWQEDVEALYELLVENGHTHEEAQKMSLEKLQRAEKVGAVNDALTLRKQIPIKELDKALGRSFKSLDKPTQGKVLWSIGIDSKSFPYTTDIGVFYYNDKRGFGELLFGQERLDKDWVTKTHKGFNTASFEAQVKSKGDKSLEWELRSLGGC